MPRGALGAWWAQGLRTALLRAPRWSRLPATPAVVLVLVAVPFAFSLLVERLYIVGDAHFYWPGLVGGWLGTLIASWACWLATTQQAAPADVEGPPPPRPATAALFAMLQAQALGFVALSGLLFVPMARNASAFEAGLGRHLYEVTFGLFVAWYLAAQMRLLWRSGAAPPAARRLALAALVAAAAVQQGVVPAAHWYPAPNAEAAQADPAFRLTQDVMELQPTVLQAQLQALAPGPADRVNVFAITFAPYAGEDVFKRESELVAAVMAQRFGATGRTLQLVNHRDTARTRPWATPLNLQRAIRRAAALMKPDDLLFIHLTSHGARNGELAAEFEPMTLDALTPQQLTAWLDEAGVRHRVISVSACYSGSWIEPLAGDDTLVMTAADATHTSYGCGRGSTYTFFGRAMFNEQLRRGFSFEAAHAAARLDIDARERAAGKSDGYSNPQIRVGDGIRPTLERLAAQQAVLTR